MQQLQKDFFSRRGVGIYRRQFHWIPNHGNASINRRIPGCNRLGDVGIKKLHFFESISRPGFVDVRERSCHKCAEACALGKFENCLHNERCGCYRILELSPVTAISRISTRLHRENGALAFAEGAKCGDFFVTGHVNLSSEKFTLFAISKDSFLRKAEEEISCGDGMYTHTVHVGDFVVDAIPYACVSAGGTVFTPH